MSTKVSSSEISGIRKEMEGTRLDRQPRVAGGKMAGGTCNSWHGPSGTTQLS